MVEYRVRNWDRHYETNKTRPLKTLTWIALPVALDSDGYAELLEHPNGAAHFGIFVALLEVSARCVPRGCLRRARKVPHDAASLSRVCRVPAQMVQEALDRLVSIGWIETWHDQATAAPERAASVPGSCPETGDTLPVVPGGPVLPNPTGITGVDGREDRLDTTNRDDRLKSGNGHETPPPNPPTGGSPSALEKEAAFEALKESRRRNLGITPADVEAGRKITAPKPT